MKKLIWIVILELFLTIFLGIFNSSSLATVVPSVSYTTHVQNIGWQDYVTEGNQAGTSGKGLRLEGIKINLQNNSYGGEIQYATHVQNIGWQDYVKTNQMAGTSGKGLRLEAIKIKLTGEIAQYYDVYYKVHAQNFGWLDWAKNGEEAGTSGYGYRLEAIQIRLVKKGTKFEGSTTTPYRKATPTIHVNYTTHVQDIGWQNIIKDGGMAGTSGKGLRLEAIKINLSDNYLGGSIQYRTHVQNIGWQNFVQDGDLSGTSGKGLRLEAIQIQLTGAIAQKYDITYRVHVQNEGWQSWKKNGETAGTSGKGLRLEAIEVKLVAKQTSGGTNIGGNNTSTITPGEPVETPIEKPVYAIQGIDVSSYQQEINWKAVKTSGVQFTMIRAGFRGYGISSDGIDGKLVVDERFDYNIRNALVAKIPVGVYFFSQAKTEEEAIQEANLVLDLVNGYQITYPIAIDTEYANSTHTGRADNLSVEERTKVVKAFCDTIQKAGYIPMVYTGKNFAMNNLNIETLSTYDLWLSHYTGATQENPLEKPSDYTGKYTIWQYTSSGQVEGINTLVDRNICYKVYGNE